MKTQLKQIPDGGWGWVIVASVALINMTNQSVLSVFGLLFGGQLKIMHHQTFTAALINNLNSAILNFSGLFIGPTIKKFEVRKIAAIGCMLVSMGLCICAFATDCWHFIVGYSFLLGLGLGLISPSTFLAINAYFSNKRGRAVGVSLAGAGLGQVFIPHLVRFVLDNYGFQATVLCMALLSSTGILGALMLKPLKQQCVSYQVCNTKQHLQLLTNSEAHNKTQLNNILEIKFVNQTNEDELMEKSHTDNSCQCDNNVQNTITDLSKESITIHPTLCKRLLDAMNLELLKNFAFCNIIIGMGLVYTATINFTMIFPNFLQYSLHYSRSTTANFMSIMAGADIICRLLLPCITDKLKLSFRLTFLFGTIALMIVRVVIAESTDFITIAVMSILTGMAKAATVLNNNLTISAYCQPEKLPGGLGLSMITKGLMVVSIGQIFASIRDLTNSYILCLHAQNAFLLLVITVWMPEMLYTYAKQLTKRRDDNRNILTIRA